MFYPLCFQCYEVSPRFPLIWSFFASITSSGTSSYLSSQPLSSFMSRWVYLHQVPLVRIQLCHSLFLCCTFIFVDQSLPHPLCIIHSIFGFITGRQGGNLIAHFVVPCVNLTAANWLITDTLWKEWCDLSLILMHICYLRCDLYTEELAVKRVLYAVTHSHYTMAAEIWTLFLGN